MKLGVLLILSIHNKRLKESWLLQCFCAGYMYLYMLTSAYTCYTGSWMLKVKVGCLSQSSTTLIFETRSFTEPGAYGCGLTCWKRSYRDLPVLSLDIGVTMYRTAFTWCQDLNSGLHAYTTRTLQTDPSLSLRVDFSKQNKIKLSRSQHKMRIMKNKISVIHALIIISTWI